MTMKSCNEKLKLATARHKSRKTEKANYDLSRQTLLTNLRYTPDVLDTLYNNS